MALNLSQLDGTNGFRLDGIDAYDYSGFSVAGAGDVNGDGIDDLIVGAPAAIRRQYRRRELCRLRHGHRLRGEPRSLGARRHERLPPRRDRRGRLQRLLGRGRGRRQRRRHRRPDRRGPGRRPAAVLPARAMSSSAPPPASRRASISPRSTARTASASTGSTRTTAAASRSRARATSTATASTT